MGAAGPRASGGGCAAMGGGRGRWRGAGGGVGRGSGLMRSGVAKAGLVLVVGVIVGAEEVV